MTDNLRRASGGLVCHTEQTASLQLHQGASRRWTCRPMVAGLGTKSVKARKPAYLHHGEVVTTHARVMRAFLDETSRPGRDRVAHIEDVAAY